MQSRMKTIMLACVPLVALASSSAPAMAAAQSVGPARVAHSTQLPSWALLPSPNRAGMGNSLDGMSCSSATACTAVGMSHKRGRAPQTLTEFYNAAGWSIVPSRNPMKSSALRAVSCPTASFCMAVGWRQVKGIEPKTLAESWNGTSWSVVPSPNPSSGSVVYDVFLNVSCASPSACMAVGLRESSDLIEFWNGTRWSVMHPRPGSGVSDVSCATADSCLAVGGSSAKYWNGSTWSAVPGPKTTPQADLTSVSCVAAKTCTATGQSGTTHIAASWNGTTWSVRPLPGTGGPDYLSRISCATSSACTAVGYAQNPTTLRYSTLVEYWDGTAWSILPSPNEPGTSESYLYGVSCPSATECLASGDGGGRTLTEIGTSPGA